jgi:putative FmdB family regulatory protein
MPTYEYLCSGCGHRFEVFQKMSDEPVKNCLECNGVPERIISPGAGLLFKGSGFYVTDYRSESYKKKAKEESNQGLEKKTAKKTKKE